MHIMTIKRFGSSSLENATNVTAHVTNKIGAIEVVVGEFQVKVLGTYPQINDYLVYEVTQQLISAGCQLSPMSEPIVGKADQTPYGSIEHFSAPMSSQSIAPVTP